MYHDITHSMGNAQIELASHTLERPNPRPKSRSQGQITQLSVCCSGSYRPFEAEEIKTIARHFHQLKKLCLNSCRKDRIHATHAMYCHQWVSSDNLSLSSKWSTRLATVCFLQHAYRSRLTPTQALNFESAIRELRKQLKELGIAIEDFSLANILNEIETEHEDQDQPPRSRGRITLEWYEQQAAELFAAIPWLDNIFIWSSYPVMYLASMEEGKIGLKKINIAQQSEYRSRFPVTPDDHSSASLLNE
jgi:hypothetical protein